MSSKILQYLFVGAVIIGLADSLYLSLTTLLEIPPVCGPLHGCETVAASSYSRLLGIPLAYLGSAYYFFGALMSGMLLTSPRVRTVALAYGTVGALASVWFLYVQAVLINALCVYCIISAVVTFALFAITSSLFRHARKIA